MHKTSVPPVLTVQLPNTPDLTISYQMGDQQVVVPHPDHVTINQRLNKWIDEDALSYHAGIRRLEPEWYTDIQKNAVPLFALNASIITGDPRVLLSHVIPGHGAVRESRFEFTPYEDTTVTGLLVPSLGSFPLARRLRVDAFDSVVISLLDPVSVNIYSILKLRTTLARMCSDCAHISDTPREQGDYL